MASVTSQALLAQGANAVAARPGWHWPLSVAPDTPIWRDHSLFSDNAWLAAIQYAASLVPKSTTWQQPLSVPTYPRQLPSITDASSFAGNWLSSAGIVPAATPAFIGWQQELSVSRITKRPIWADESSYDGVAWFQAASVISPAVAFLARTSGLDATHTNAYTALINGLVSDGVWAKLDMLHVYATQDSTTALLNLVSTSYNGTTNGSPSFSVDLGFSGVTSSGSVYIDTNFNPATATSPQYVRNSAHISAWSLTSAAAGASNAGIIIGAQNGSGSQSNIFPRYQDGKAYFRVNGGGIAGTTNADGTGHYVANRSSSSAVEGYRNASSVQSASDTSVAVFNFNITSLCQNNAGTVATGFGGQVAMASIGSSLSAGDVTLFYNRLRTYMTAVGVP